MLRVSRNVSTPTIEEWGRGGGGGQEDEEDEDDEEEQKEQKERRGGENVQRVLHVFGRKRCLVGAVGISRQKCGGVRECVRQGGRRKWSKGKLVMVKEQLERGSC